MYATEHQAALLRAAVEEIKKHPETFDMNVWIRRRDCGTVCCLAGQIVRNAVSDAQWNLLTAAFLAKGPVPSIAARAERILDGAHGVANLFVLDFWPDKFLTPRVCHRDHGPRPCICDRQNPKPEQLEARVEHWIATGE
jgi:hypothetical protein